MRTYRVESYGKKRIGGNRSKIFSKYVLVPTPLIHKLKLKNAYDVHKYFDISLEAAGYAFSYYCKWLTYGNKDYTDYELRLLRLFKEAV